MIQHGSFLAVAIELDEIRPAVNATVGGICIIVVSRDRSKESVNAAAVLKAGAGLAMQMQLGRPRWGHSRGGDGTMTMAWNTTIGVRNVIHVVLVWLKIRGSPATIVLNVI